MILAGFSAYSRNLSYAKFRKIADEVDAILMMDMAHIAGLVAGKALPNPVRICDVVTTTTHKTLRGPRGGMILCKKKFTTRGTEHMTVSILFSNIIMYHLRECTGY